MLQKNTLCRYLILLALVFAGQSLALVDDEIDLYIPEQNLVAALLSLGRQSNVSIIIVADIPDSLRSVPIEQRMSSRDAIETLLADTNFKYRQHNPKVLSVIEEKRDFSFEDLDEPTRIELMNVIGRKVTGSNIRQYSLDGSAPLDIISSLEIERSGAQTLADLIKFIPAVSGNSTSTAVSNGGDGTTKVTLRGLPANNTLVLINGKRVAFDGLAGDSVDLNAIAPVAIDRLEILKDGASAVYGSDAIAGVVNIVVKETFDGVYVDQYGGVSDNSDLETVQTNGLFGIDREAGSALLALSYYQQKGLYSRDRALSASADARDMGGADYRVSATVPARITLADGSPVILDTNESGAFLPGTSPNDYRDANSEDLFDFRTQSSSISPSERFGLYANTIFNLSDTLKTQTFLLASETDAVITLASSPLYTAFLSDPITVDASNIYNPFDESISDVRRRIIELAPREQRNKSHNVHINTGLHYLGDNVEWEANIFWNRTKAKEIFSNLLSRNELARAVGPSDNCLGIEIDECEPLNLFGPPGSITEDQLSNITASVSAEGISRLFGFDANLAGSLSNEHLSSYSLGLSWRKEKSVFSPNQENSSSIIGGAFDSSTQGQRELIEAYGEYATSIPGFSKLDIELAMRYTRSTDYGENTSPKLGLKFKPINGLLLRGTLSTGFRAPSINELYKTGSTSFSSLSDPCSIESNVGTLVGCTQLSDSTLNQFLTEFRGADNLEPEESMNAIFGFFAQPTRIPALSFSADAFSIKQTNVIDANPQVIVEENARNGLFSDLVQRDANGNITLVSAPFINVGKRLVQGVDLNVNYKMKNPNIDFRINASYLHRFRSKLNEFSVEEELAGTFQDAAEEGSGSLPRWKINSGMVVKNKNWEWNYNINYIHSLRESFQTDEIVFRDINSWTIHNTQLQLFADLKIIDNVIFGVDNIFDRSPPFAASAFNDNYDARTYNLRGRYYYLKISNTFF